MEEDKERVFFNPLLFMYLDDDFTTNKYFNMSLDSLENQWHKRIIDPSDWVTVPFFHLFHQYSMTFDLL